MSLTNQEMIDTKEQFQQNLLLSGVTLDEIAADLHTKTAVIEQTLDLQTHHIEDPWILKNYLEEKILSQGQTPVPFTALAGDYHDYWFLNSRRIEKKKLG